MDQISERDHSTAGAQYEAENPLLLTLLGSSSIGTWVEEVFLLGSLSRQPPAAEAPHSPHPAPLPPRWRHSRAAAAAPPCFALGRTKCGWGSDTHGGVAPVPNAAAGADGPECPLAPV